MGELGIGAAALVALVFLMAGMIKGLVGIGLPTASLAMLTLMLPPKTAMALVIIPLLVTNLHQIARSGRVLEVASRFLPLVLTMVPFIWLSTNFLPRMNNDMILGAIGLVLVLFAVTNMMASPPPIPARLDKWVQVPVGVVAGVLGGLTTIWSPPLFMHLISLRLEKDDFVRAAGFIIFVGGLPLAAGFWANGLLTGPSALLSALFCLPAIAGYWLGERVRSRVSQARFRKILLLVFFLMGLNLIRRAIF